MTPVRTFEEAPVPETPRTPARHAAVCVAVLLASLLCGGCAGHAKARTATAPAPAAASGARPAGLQELASALGCTPEITVDAEELREGACGAGEGAYRMATFSADEGLRAWLAESRGYGGTYLVGDRWVVTAASADALAPLRERLGGTVETGDAHGADHAHGSDPAHPMAPMPGMDPAPGG